MTMTHYKHLFQRAIAAAPDRLHFAAHSHHLWPDASFVGHQAAWDDAMRLADHKWGRVMGEIWPAAQQFVAEELKLPDPNTVAFAQNTHDLFIRILSARDERPIRLLTSDGEFHSFRRQVRRLAESGAVSLEIVPHGPNFAQRFIAAAKTGRHDVIFVSHVFYEHGGIFDGIEELAQIARPDGAWVVIDGYHGFMAVETDLSAVADRIFYLAGGYKYAMAGEGAGFVHCPPGFAPRPKFTGWFADFSHLDEQPRHVAYPQDAQRFLGATFDPSGIYRFVAVRDMMTQEGLTTAAINAHIAPLRQSVLDAIGDTPLSHAELLNPGTERRARFLAFRSQKAAQWRAQLDAQDIITDVRGNVLRIGFGLYHDQRDVDRLTSALRNLRDA